MNTKHYLKTVMTVATVSAFVVTSAGHINAAWNFSNLRSGQVSNPTPLFNPFNIFHKTRSNKPYGYQRRFFNTTKLPQSTNNNSEQQPAEIICISEYRGGIYDPYEFRYEQQSCRIQSNTLFVPQQIDKVIILTGKKGAAEPFSAGAYAYELANTTNLPTTNRAGNTVEYLIDLKHLDSGNATFMLLNDKLDKPDETEFYTNLEPGLVYITIEKQGSAKASILSTNKNKFHIEYLNYSDSTIREVSRRSLTGRLKRFFRIN